MVLVLSVQLSVLLARLQRNISQLIQPIGGVFAKLFLAWTRVAALKIIVERIIRLDDLMAVAAAPAFPPRPV